MFFRRQEGRYRETDRVTRYKLIKSGKHWLRASTSLFGLFKVLRGGVDTAQVTTEVVEDRVSTSITGLDILKGIAAAGAVVGGGVATHTQVHANEQLAVEKVVDGTDNLVNTDQAVLGTVNKDEEQQTSVSTSNSISESISLSDSTSASTSVSTSLSESVSASTSASTSTSVSSSTSASTSSSLNDSDSTSASTSSSLNDSDSTSDSTSTVASSSLSEVSHVEGSQRVSGENTISNDRVSRATVDASNVQVNPDLSSSLSTAENFTSQNASLTATTTATLAATTTAETSAKKQAEDRKKLATLSTEMGEYLAKAVDLPDTSSAILKVKSAITEIESALKDPNADLGTVVKIATSARNSIANAVSRATSGQRDSRNGQPMATGENLRGISPIVVNNRSNAATLNAQVATSSQPFTSTNTSGNYSGSMSSTVSTGGAGQDRATSRPPKISLPKDVTYFNDDSISTIYMQMSDDKGLKRLDAGPNNTIITGLAAPNYPRSKQGVYGDFGVYNQWGKLLYYPKISTVDIQGTIGRNNGIGIAGRADGAWEPYKPGAHILEYVVTDSDGQKDTARMTLHIKGFNERNEPVSGATVTVNNPSSLI